MPKDIVFFIAFIKKGRGERDKQRVAASCRPPDQGPDLQPFAYGAMLLPTEPHWPGRK